MGASDSVLKNADEIKVVLACLDNLPYKLKEVKKKTLQRKIVGQTELVERVIVPQTASVLHIGDENKYVYIILCGKVEVFSDNQFKHPIGVVPSGDYFGEVSALYDVPCTATVRAKESTMIRLHKDLIKQLSTNARYDIEDWYIRRCYVPLQNVDGITDSPFIVNSIVMNALKKTVLFCNWCDDSLESLTRSMTNKQEIEVYPEGSTLIPASNPYDYLILIIKGDVDVGSSSIMDSTHGTASTTNSDDTDNRTYYINLVMANNLPRIYGTGATVRAKTLCWTLKIRIYCIKQCLKKYPDTAGAAWKHGRMEAWKQWNTLYAKKN